MSELESPVYLEEETGDLDISDNRKHGRKLTDTKPKGNKILETVFRIFNSKKY